MRQLLLTLVAVIVLGCSTTAGRTETPTSAPSVQTPTSGPGTEMPTSPPTSQPSEAQVSVTGDPDTGASGSFTLAGGAYEIAWTTTADTAGCYFALFLTTKVDGPSVMNDVKLLPEARSYSSTFLWLIVRPGTYVLQEDRSGFGHCKGPWTATLTRR